MALPKISKMQQRLMGGGSGRFSSSISVVNSPKGAIVTAKKNPIQSKEPEGTQIVFMGVRDFREYDKTDALVISITNPEDRPLTEHPAAKAWLGLSFNPVFEPSGWFQKEHANKIVEFLQANQDANRLIVHCGQGEYRSSAIALGIHMALSIRNFELTGEDNAFAYFYKDGNWMKQATEPEMTGCQRTFGAVWRSVDKSLTQDGIKQFGDIKLVKDESPE